VSPELAREIAEVLAGPDRRGYWIRRENTFLGRVIRGSGWQHDRVLRLFDRSCGRYEERRVHEEVRIDGKAGVLQHRIVHHSCRDLSTWLAKTERYAVLGAHDAWASGRRAQGADLVFRPLARFLKQYVLQAGFRDGPEGGMLCAISAFGVFWKYATLRELTLGRRELEP
jgi:hypothetical protein